MKRGWIAVIMIAMSLICGGFEYYYVTANTEAYIVMLNDAEEKMAESKVYEAESAARRLDNRFGKDAAVINMFMNHSGTESIGCDLAMLQMYARTGDTEEYMATSAKAKREITDIRRSMDFSWGNIF